MMNKPGLNRVFGMALLVSLLACSLGGCGDGAVTTPPAVAPTDTTKLAAALPEGVTLQTPVRPDKAYGESVKTVEDALKSLIATVKDGTIYDALGHEIRFESEGAPAIKPAAKAKGTPIVVHLAK
jgi:hypothetical protein